MTREECEHKIKAIMLELVNVYREYNPEGEYLSCAFTNNTILFNNAYYDEDKDHKIDGYMHNVYEPRQYWYFTFGCGQEHGGKYVKIKGTFASARYRMVEKYEDKWSMQYSEKEWEAMKNDSNRFWDMETELEVIE